MKSNFFRIALLSMISGALLLSACKKDDDDDNDNDDAKTSQTEQNVYKPVVVKKWTKDYSNDEDYFSVTYNRNSNGFVTSIDALDYYVNTSGEEVKNTSSMKAEHSSSAFKLYGKNNSSWDMKFNPDGTVSEFVVTIIKVYDEEKVHCTYKYECSYNDAFQLTDVKYNYQSDAKGESPISRDYKFSYNQDGALVSMETAKGKAEYKYDKDIPNKNGQFWLEVYGAYSDDVIDDWTDEPTAVILGMFGKASTKFPTSVTVTYERGNEDIETFTFNYDFTLNDDGNILTEKVDYNYPITVTFEY